MQMLEFCAEVMGQPLDVNGVALIDYQNNGSPGPFCTLARALGFPWYLICDNDQGGKAHLTAIKNRGFADGELGNRTWQLPELDLEAYLIKNGFRAELAKVAERQNIKIKLSEADAGFDDELHDAICKHKPVSASMLIDQLRSGGFGPDSIPSLFKEVIGRVMEATK
jgi:putative ATP-dependent endonuclease of OLD family